MGYGRAGNTPDDDELIKWHADELYQKRLQEKEKPQSAQDQIATDNKE